jgi:pimeloyl-ACP methyl ester carboxylesterase
MTPSQVAAAFLTPRRTIRSTSDLGGAPVLLPFGDSALPAASFGQGPTVLLVHGWEGSRADMVPLAKALAATGHRAVVFDMPAHGQAGGDTASIPVFADALRAAARALGPIEAVVAHSVGAAATILALSQERFTDRVVLIGTPARYRDFARAFARGAGLGEMGTASMLAALGRQGLDLSAIDGPVLARRLGGVDALFLHAPDDRVVSINDARQTAAAWPGARFSEVGNLGHVRLLSDSCLAAQVTDFVADSAVALKACA